MKTAGSVHTMNVGPHAISTLAFTHLSLSHKIYSTYVAQYFSSAIMFLTFAAFLPWFRTASARAYPRLRPFEPNCPMLTQQMSYMWMSRKWVQHWKVSRRTVWVMKLTIKTNVLRKLERQSYLQVFFVESGEGSQLASNTKAQAKRMQHVACNILDHVATCWTGLAKRIQHCATWWQNTRNNYVAPTGCIRLARDWLCNNNHFITYNTTY